MSHINIFIILFIHEELCIPRGGKDVLSPREVMTAINHYNQNFNLTDQQVLDLIKNLIHFIDY